MEAVRLPWITQLGATLLYPGRTMQVHSLKRMNTEKTELVGTGPVWRDIDHNKHPLPTTQEKTLHMDITRWSTLKSD